MLEFSYLRQTLGRRRSLESQTPIDLSEIRGQIEQLRLKIHPSTYDSLVESCDQIQSVLEQGNIKKALELKEELKEQLKNIERGL